ncbi:MAG: Rne/Rng family ribonuclease [Planctomycetes bacterium]|nr:Rne/Rng family ribonuclease [Planctomycetota bacterium]
MSKKILMNVAEGDECRIAVVEDGRLFEYFVDRPSQLKHLGNIYKGIVSNVEPGIQAAFIDLGLDRNGFLHVSDTLQAYARTQSVTELYHQVTRAAGAPEMPPYGEQVPPQEVKEEGGFTEEAESLSESTSQTEESGSDSGSTEDDNDSESDAASKEREEPEFLDNLTQVTPGHNVTHSPTEVLADRGDSGRMPAIRPAEQPQAAPIRHVEAPRPAEKPPEPDVVPGKVSEHEELGIVPQPKLPRKKRDPLALFQTPPAATDFKLPAPPKKKRSGMFHAVPAPQDTPSAEPRIGDQGPKEADGSFDRDGNPSGDDGTGAAPRRFMRGPLPKVQNLLKRGQEVMVQVTKASQGGKGPGLSTYLSLPGRYMVLMPNSNKGGVSRKIDDDSQRDNLRKMLDTLPVPEGMGVVIRTAAIGRTFDELSRDLNYLLRLWNVIVQRIHEAPAPALIYADTDPAIRAVRDYFTADTDEIIIDDRSAYERVLAFFDTTMPSLKERVKLYEKEVPLFYAEGIETQIDHIFDKKVPLKSGGYLYIEQTEALVAIDVNSGKFTSAGDAEQTAYRTNVEAIPEIVRQLRLRDLGGIICNDFIDMLGASHRAEIENALKRELRKDRARTKIARMSPFGVMEMTRQRVRPSIRAYTYVPCPTCTGSGHVRSAETLCLTLIRQMKLALSEERVKSLMVQVHPHVLSHLHSEFREDMDQLEEKYDKRIIFEFARDLVLGDARIFYVNDRDMRVLYDLDQRINQFVKEAEHQSRGNVPLPPASLGVAGQPEPDVRFSDRRGRRGGKRQRDRDLERQVKMLRTTTENAKAVPSFGAEMPELPAAPAGAPVPTNGNGQQRERFRDRRDRGRRRDRTGAPQQGQAVPQMAAGAPEGNAPVQPTEGAMTAPPASQPIGLEPASAVQPVGENGSRPVDAAGKPIDGAQGRRRRGRRGGRRRREREERRRQMTSQGQPGQAGQAGQPVGQSQEAQAPAQVQSAPATPAEPQGVSSSAAIAESAPAAPQDAASKKGSTSRRAKPAETTSAAEPATAESAAGPKKRAARKKPEPEGAPKRAPRKKADAAEKPVKKAAARKPAAKKSAKKK